MDQLLYGRRPLAERDGNAKVPRMSSMVDAPHEIVPLSPPSMKTASMPSPLRSVTVSPTRQPEEASELAAYASQSPADRDAALEDFMMRHLEDPSFATTCEDMERCWRRIALGL